MSSVYVLVQVEKEVTDLMHKALKYCDLEHNTVRLPQCQYRAATVHHRLASLYHWNDNTDFFSHTVAC